MNVVLNVLIVEAETVREVVQMVLFRFYRQNLAFFEVRMLVR